MKAIVTSIGLGILIFVVLAGGGALFGHIAEVNAAGVETAITCQELEVRVIPSGGAVTLVNQGEHTVSGTLTVERDGAVVHRTAVAALRPGEPTEVPIPEDGTTVFRPDGCNRTFTGSSG